MWRYCFLSSFVEPCSAVTEEKLKCLSQSNWKAGVAVLVFRSDRKKKFGSGRLDLASCEVSLNSVQRFQRSRKCLNQSEAGAAIIVFQSSRKTKSWKRTFRSCFLWSFVELRSVFSEEKSKMYQPIRGRGGHLVFPIVLKKKPQTW